MKKRQYRSNQGRNPESEEAMFKAIKIAFRIVIKSKLLISILSPSSLPPSNIINLTFSAFEKTLRV